MIRTLFIGTAEFGIPTLEFLLKSEEYSLVGVITQPDKPAGRKQKMKKSPVKEFVEESGAVLDVLQPEVLKLDAERILADYDPELIVVAAYGQMIPNSMLDHPKFGCLNLHGSLLPKLRGAVPVQMSILHGFTETGVTLQKMVQKMDAGPIISQGMIKLSHEETTETLMHKLSLLAVQILKRDLSSWVEGKIVPKDQEESEATYCFVADLKKENAEITFRTDSDMAERMIRAFNPWPTAWFFHSSGKRVKILRAEKVSYSDIGIVRVEESLSVIKIDKSIYLSLHDGLLRLGSLQLEGKKAGPSTDYLYLADK